MTKVLILLSTFNGQRHLEEQLESLKSQVEVDLFYLIRDDGSFDGTVEILNNFRRQVPNVELMLGKNVGVVKSFWLLLNHAIHYLHKMDYFAFCDQDDIWLKNKLSVASNRLKEMPIDEPSLYCSNLMLIDELGEPIKKMRPIGSKFSKASSLVESIATGCTMVFNQKTLELFRDFPPTYMTMHDLWIFHLCIFVGNVFYDDSSYILYRQHENNVIGANTSFLQNISKKLKSFKTLLSQHHREREAREILNVYDELLSEKDKDLLRVLTDFRKDSASRLNFLFSQKHPDLRMTNPSENFFLKLRIILGRV